MAGKWKFSKDWEEKVREIVRDEFSKHEDWFRLIIQDELQKVEGVRRDMNKAEVARK